MIDNPWLGTTLLKPIDVIVHDHIESNLRMREAKTTVIISLLNEMSSVGTLLLELSQQTYLPTKVIIVDGGSVDGSWEYLKSASLANPQMELHQLAGSTPAEAMNYAMKLCDGDLI